MTDRPQPDETVDELPSGDPAPPSFGPDLEPPIRTGASVFPALGGESAKMPCVHLREPLAEGVTPVNLPGSPEMPGRENPPNTSPRLQFLGEIARGGMGAILKGRDVDLGRDLAVKVLLEAHQGKPEMLQRFVEEAQISGQLQHPGIAPVHELGVLPDGRPYFTMKLVKGQTLAAQLAARKDGLADRPRLLGVFAQVCQTLAYAHARGVIHRDLKPSNVMVGAFGEVQVMDWGLAKVLQEGGIADELRGLKREWAETVSVIRTARSRDDGTPEAGSHTQAGTLLGTPAYMAPEQARGEVELVDERADVFGLGAILCEVLTGRPPFTGKPAEAQRKAQNALLDDAYRRLDGCGADAELIALAKHCLAAEPWDRPPNAGEVAARVTAYQNAVAERLRQAELARAAEEARAVEARATAAQERRARRLTLMLAATVLLTVLLGGGGWLWLDYQQEEKRHANDRLVSDAYNQADSLHKQAREAPEREARELAARAREQLRRAEALVESGPTDPALVTQLDVLRRELDADDKDRTLLEALEAARLAQADSDSEGNTFATKQHVLPLFREAFRDYGMPVGEGEAEAAAARLRERPEAVREAVLAAVDAWIAAAEDPRANIDEPHLSWLRALLTAAEPEGWAKQVREAAAEPDFYQRRVRLANLAAMVEKKRLPPQALTRLADRLLGLGDCDAALTLLQWAQRQYPQDFWINEYLGQYLLRYQPRVTADAVAYLRAAVALRPGSAGARLNLTFALRMHGRQQEAVALLRQLVADNPRFGPAYLSLGTALEQQGDWPEAIAAFRKVLELTVNSRPDTIHQFAFNALYAALKKQGRLDELVSLGREAVQRHPDQAWPYQSLSNILQQQGQKADVIALWQQACQQNPKAVWPYSMLGLSLNLQGRRDEAIAAYRQACQRDPKSAASYANLSQLLQQQGKAEEALAVWREAIQRHPNETWPYIAFSHFLTQQGKRDQAQALLREASQQNPKAAWPHYHLGNILEGQGKLDAAIAEYKKVLELEPESPLGPLHLCSALKEQGKSDEILAVWREAMQHHPGNPYFYNQLLNALREQGKHDEIVAVWRDLVQRYPADAGSHYELGWALKEQGRLDAAIAEYKKAIELNPHHTVAHDNLGYARFLQGKYDEAITECRIAIALSPWHANSHNSLALALWEQGKSNEAVAAYRKAIELAPAYTAAHANLGHALYALNQLEEAAAEYRKASEQGDGDATFRWRRCQRLLALGERLPAILQGEKPPPDAVLRIDLADLCYRRKHYARSTQLFAEAFAADGKLIEDIHAVYRYDAACSAALAGCGQGEDAKKSDAKERTRLRHQALDWLRADLTSYGKLVDSGKPADRSFVQQRLQYWHQDRDLIGLRDAKEMAKLPADERQACEKLWADVKTLLQRADAK